MLTTAECECMVSSKVFSDIKQHNTKPRELPEFAIDVDNDFHLEL